MTRLTDGDDDCFAVFTRDGRSVVFTRNQGGRYNLFRVPLDGDASLERLTDSPDSQRPTSVSPNGQVLLYNNRGPATGMDVGRLDHGVASPLIRTRFREREAVFAPDGRWIAYVSNDSGSDEIYVQAYPAGSRSQVSTGGGFGPAWNPKGGELFYQGPSAVMAVRIVDGRRMGVPTALFPHVSEYRDWDVSPDGQRFLVVERSEPTNVSLINIVTNWASELTSLVPARR